MSERPSSTDPVGPRTPEYRKGPASPPPTVTRRGFAVGAAGLGAVSALGLAGCSNEGRGGAAIGDNTDVQLPTYQEYKGIKPDLEGKDGSADAILHYPKDPKKVTEGTPGDGKDFGIFAMTNSPAPPAMGKNAFWQEMNERLGCTMDLSIVPTSDFADRFQTTIAGDKLPEIFTFFPNQVPSLPSMLNERAADLTDLLSGDAVLKYPFLANVPTESWQSCAYGGKLYAIPIPRGGRQASVMYGRIDLLEKMGIDPSFDSLDDFVDACTEMRGGKRWALGQAPLDYVRQMFEIPNGWSEQDGKLTSANEDERQQDALEATRKLVSDGLVHPDAFAVDQSKNKTWTGAGTTMLLWDTFTAWPYFFTNSGFDKDLWIDVIRPPKADGGGAAPIWHGPTFQNITAISKKAEDRAEDLLDVINYFAAPFGSEEYRFKVYGIEGTDYDLDGTDPVRNQNGMNETAMGLEYVGAGPQVIYTPGNEDVVKAQYKAEAACVPTAVKNPVVGLYSETDSRKGNQINTRLSDTEKDILQGRKPVSAWADAVKTWKKGGGDTMRDEYQEALANALDG